MYDIEYDVSVYCVVFLLFVFFFFKQKTAYESRISDWSSDVCSPDLPVPEAVGPDGRGHPRGRAGRHPRRRPLPAVREPRRLVGGGARLRRPPVARKSAV